EGALAARDQRVIDGERDAREVAVVCDAVGERGIAEHALARHGVGGRRLHGAAVGEEVARGVGRELALADHLLPIGRGKDPLAAGELRGGDQREGERRDDVCARAPHAANLPNGATRAAPHWRSSSGVRARSSRSSRSSTASQKRSTLARSKPSTLNSGCVSPGSPSATNRITNPLTADASTPDSNVMGMNAGIENGGRPPTLIG